MIKYNAVQNKYVYKTEDLEKVLETIKSGNFYNMNCCTQENITSFVKVVNYFVNNIETVEENVVLERHETEEEARKYFGEEFISKFDQLLTVLDRQETIVALHGTNEEVCPLICQEGLKYKTPSLSSTAVQQSMAYGQNEMHYKNYESLLNWGHKNYKGLVVLAIPYECFYKEGLWNKFQDTNSSMYGGQDYKIDPDFVAGYLDVTQKKIVINPKYNRQHNYEGYIKDNELFRDIPDMDNDKIKQSMIESSKLDDNEVTFKQDIVEEENEQFDVSRIPYVIEDLIGTFNSIKMGFPDGMSEERYKYFLKELSYGFNDIVKIIPLLKTEEQIRKEQEEKFSMFSDNINTLASTNQESDFDDFDWDDGSEWEEEEEQQSHKTL